MARHEPSRRCFAGSRGELCWFEWAKASAAPSILLLHATGFHGRCWDQVVAQFPEGAHVIAPDLAGHGRSYRPDSLRDWTAIADDVGALLKSLAMGPVVGVGHSMGGFALAHTAAHAADQIARIILVDPVILPKDSYQSPFFPADMAVADHPVARRRNRWDDPGAMTAHFASRPPYSGWQRPVLDDYCHHGLLPAPDGDGWELACTPQLEASTYMGSAASDPHGWLERVACPALVLRAPQRERQGSMDFSNSPTWTGLADALPQGRDFVWSDCTHFIPMEQPQRLAELIIDEWRACA